jgi:hypothetical protein
VIRSTLTFLNLPIGRGHPYYLEGILEVFNRSGKIGLVRSLENVFDLTPFYSRIGWSMVERLYRHGSSPGQLGSLYNRLRQKNDFNRRSLTMSFFGSGLRSRFSKVQGPVLVSHPMLVGILKGSCHLIYQHGELVAPDESLVTGANLVIVPTQDVASRFKAVGYSAEQILVSGACIEPSLVRQAADAYQSRVLRYSGSEPLTGAFFSSGAEPSDHVERLVAAVKAALSVDHRVLIFAKQGGRLAKAVNAALQPLDLPYRTVDATSEIPSHLEGATLLLFDNRRQETVLTSRLFPHFDYFVAPAHERSNWAIGLGLPLFMLEPSKGSFAPLNRQLLLDQRVATSLSSLNHAASLGARVDSFRNKGTLREMAESGYRFRDISGFETIATYLSEKYGFAID